MTFVIRQTVFFTFYFSLCERNWSYFTAHLLENQRWRCRWGQVSSSQSSRTISLVLLHYSNHVTSATWAACRRHTFGSRDTCAWAWQPGQTCKAKYGLNWTSVVIVQKLVWCISCQASIVTDWCRTTLVSWQTAMLKKQGIFTLVRRTIEYKLNKLFLEVGSFNHCYLVMLPRTNNDQLRNIMKLFTWR